MLMLMLTGAFPGEQRNRRRCLLSNSGRGFASLRDSCPRLSGFSKAVTCLPVRSGTWLVTCAAAPPHGGPARPRTGAPCARPPGRRARGTL